MKQFTESAGEGIGVQGTRGGEFGGGFEDTLGNQGHDQIALVAGFHIDELVKL
jgi:hypothetical protein